MFVSKDLVNRWTDMALYSEASPIQKSFKIIKVMARVGKGGGAIGQIQPILQNVVCKNFNKLKL